MKRKQKSDTNEFPLDYKIIFDHLKNEKETGLETKETEEIDELRKVIININEPEYTYTTSTSGYTPTFRVSIPIK